MAQAVAEQRRVYPLPAYNFQVTVGSTSARFSEVVGLSIANETVQYRQGFSYKEGAAITRYRPATYTEASLKRGTVAGDNLFGDWLSKTPAESRSMTISLCDEVGKPVVSWRIASAVPVKLTSPTFDANTNSVSIDTLDLMISGVSVENTGRL